jgi:regulatory protein
MAPYRQGKNARGPDYAERRIDGADDREASRSECRTGDRDRGSPDDSERLAEGWQDGGTRKGRRGSAKADRDTDDPESVARLICLRLLTAAPRTRAQLATALQRRGVPDDAAEAVLSRFAEVNLIDDAMFARAWVDSRHHGRGLASRALGAELRQRGVGQDDIRSALSDLDPAQEAATARALIERRLPGTVGLPLPARMRKLVGVLARKGYPAGLAYRVVREALEQEREQATERETADLPMDEFDVENNHSFSGDSCEDEAL